MKKALVFLLMTSLIGPAALAKGKGKRKRDPNAPDIDPSPAQIIGASEKSSYERSGNSNNRRSAGYSYSSSHENYQEAFNFIAEHAEACKFARGGVIAISLGGPQGIQKMYGTAAAVGDVYKMFHDAFNDNVKYSLDEETSVDCTMSKKAAKEEGKVYIDEDIFKWSTGVVFASQRIGQVLDEIGWDKVKVDGIHFTHVNANGSYIEKHNLGCEYKAVKHSRLIGSDVTKYYYDVKVDLGNWRTNLNKETIKDCITSHPIND